MNDEPRDLNGDVTPELLQKLQDIKDRCTPPASISYLAFYVLLFFCSIFLYLSYRIATDGAVWDSMRYGYGLLPLDVLMMRNAMIPRFLPWLIGSFLFLSFKFKSLRSPVFLAWFALIIFGLSVLYAIAAGQFSAHLLSRWAP